MGAMEIPKSEFVSVYLTEIPMSQKKDRPTMGRPLFSTVSRLTAFPAHALAG